MVEQVVDVGGRVGAFQQTLLIKVRVAAGRERGDEGGMMRECPQSQPGGDGEMIEQERDEDDQSYDEHGGRVRLCVHKHMESYK